MKKLYVVGLILGWMTATALAEIVIGQSADLSGGEQKQGQHLVAGAQAYFDTVNSQGGVRGQKIKLKVLDDGGKADRAKSNTAALLNEHNAAVLFGYTNRVTAEAGMAAAVDAKVPFFAPASGGESLRREHNRYVFHVRAGYNAEYQKIVDTMVITGEQNFGIVVNADDAKSKNVNQLGVEAALLKHGLKPTVVVSLPRNEIQFEEASKAVLRANPGVIVLAVSGKSMVPFILDLQQKGYTGRMASISFNITNLPVALGSAARGLIMTNIVPPPQRTTDQLVNEARRDLRLLDPEIQMTYSHLEGYMYARALVEGLKRAPGDKAEQLINALESMPTLDLSRQIRVRFSAQNHVGSNFVDIAIVDQYGRLLY